MPCSWKIPMSAIPLCQWPGGPLLHGGRNATHGGLVRSSSVALRRISTAMAFVCSRLVAMALTPLDITENWQGEHYPAARGASLRVLLSPPFNFRVSVEAGSGFWETPIQQPI